MKDKTETTLSTRILRKEIRKCELIIRNLDDRLRDVLSRKKRLEYQLSQAMDKKYG